MIVRSHSNSKIRVFRAEALMYERAFNENILILQAERINDGLLLVEYIKSYELE